MFSVGEVWGNALSKDVEPGSLIRFTSRGRQIAVSITEDVAKKLELEGARRLHLFRRGAGRPESW